MKELGYGAEYRYAHDEPNAYAAGENYFPPELKDTQYYFPTNRGMEIQIKEKLERLREQDKSAVKNGINNFNLGFLKWNESAVNFENFLKLTALFYLIS